MRNASHWLHSAPLETAFILAPPLVVTALVMLFPEFFGAASPVPPIGWLLLIVFVDVAHVYSTLFRTYLDPEEFQERRTLYTWVPLAGWIGGAILYSIGGWLFWRVLAYLAVYHFLRQQYGFAMLYSRNEKDLPSWHGWITRATIYAATIYPLVYWHASLPRNFHWFVEGDFLALSPAVEIACRVAYVGLVAAYAMKEAVLVLTRGNFNVPRNLVVGGTLVSWYVGIVHFNGDLAFTATNVITHGIPYLALIWIYGRKRSEKVSSPVFRGAFTAWGLPLFLGCLALLAYVEEGFWDAFVWRERGQLFAWFEALPRVEDPVVLSWLVPLLALPQITHYVLDGFIWRIRGADRRLREGVLR